MSADWQGPYWAAMAVLFALDAMLTVYLIAHRGSEMNGPMAWLMNRIGVQEALAVTKWCALVWIGIELDAGSLQPREALAIFLGYVALVAFNAWQVRLSKQRGN